MIASSLRPDSPIIEAVTRAIETQGAKTTPGGRELVLRCPTPEHEDRHPSARWNPSKGVWHCDSCHRGGGAIALARLLSIDLSPFGYSACLTALPSRTGAPGPTALESTSAFVYHSSVGDPLFRVMRQDSQEGKRIHQERWEGGRWVTGLKGVSLVPYRLPELIATLSEATVFIAEGEKCVDTLHNLGLVATTNPQGAGKWKDEFSPCLRGRHVIVLPDNDEVGRRHAAQVMTSVRPFAASCRILELPGLPEKGDIVDWLAAGHSRDELVDLIELPDHELDPDDPPSAMLPGLIRLIDIEKQRIEWLWPNRLALGKITVWDGDPGLGKSTTTLDIAARVSAGRSLPGQSTGRGPAGVVLLGAEDDPGDTIRPRLEAAGADLTRVCIRQSVPDGSGGLSDKVYDRAPSIPLDLPTIEADIVAIGASLLIVDPLMAFLGAGIDGHKDQDVRRALSALKTMAERTRVAVVLVRHLSKAVGAPALMRGGGSIGIIGAARFGLLVARDPEDPDRRLIAVTKSNLAVEAETLAYRLESVEATDVARVVWDGISNLRADELVRPPEDEQNRVERNHAVEFLHDSLHHGARPANDVKRDARDEGISDKQLRTAREKLGIKPAKSSVTGPWMWSLPIQDAQLVAQDA